MTYCPKCGINNENDAKSCYYCGANLTESTVIDDSQYTGKSSKGNALISLLDFSAIGKGLLIGLLIGIVTIGFIGLLVGGIITGYYATNKKRKYVAINGWIVGFISMIIWAIISFLLPSSGLIKSFMAAESVIGSTGLTLALALVIWLVLWALLGLLGAAGGIIGLKIAKRRNN